MKWWGCSPQHEMQKFHLCWACFLYARFHVWNLMEICWLDSNLSGEGSGTLSVFWKIKKRNIRALDPKYFSTWIFTWWPRIFLNSVLLFTNGKILFLPLNTLLSVYWHENIKNCHQTPYRRRILSRFRTWSQNWHNSPESWIINKNVFFRFAMLGSFLAPPER